MPHWSGLHRVPTTKLITGVTTICKILEQFSGQGGNENAQWVGNNSVCQRDKTRHSYVLCIDTHEEEYRNVSIYIFYFTSSIFLWVYHKNTHTSFGCVIFLFGQLLEPSHGETSKWKKITSWVGLPALRVHFKQSEWLRTAKIPQEKHCLLCETWPWTMLIYFWTWTLYYLLFYCTFLKHAHHF